MSGFRFPATDKGVVYVCAEEPGEGDRSRWWLRDVSLVERVSINLLTDAIRGKV